MNHKLFDPSKYDLNSETFKVPLMSCTVREVYRPNELYELKPCIRDHDSAVVLDNPLQF